MSRTPVHLTGRTFGRLSVLHRAGSIDGGAAWQCVCTCGQRRIIRGSSLCGGVTLSCGCLRREASAERMANIRGAGRRRYTVEEIIAQTFAADPQALLKRLGIKGLA